MGSREIYKSPKTPFAAQFVEDHPCESMVLKKDLKNRVYKKSVVRPEFAQVSKN